MKPNLFLLVAALTGLATPVLADARDEVQARELRCAGIADAKAWLDCYYGAAEPMRRQLDLQAAPALSSNPPQSGVKAGGGGWVNDMFGSTRSANTPVASRIESFSFDRSGLFTVSLVNGQVWQQLPDDANRAHWHGPTAHYNILIRPDASGGFQLTVQGMEPSDLYRVHRLH